jgi:chemotaxis protein histidine kinase CheA
MDVSSVISDITDNESVQTYFEFVNLFKLQIQTATVEALKLKCKSNNIQLYSKLKQPELVDCLVTFFTKILDIVKELNLLELKNICKNNGLKGFSSLKKSELISLIMNYNAGCSKPEFIYKIEPQIKEENKEEKLSKSELLKQLEQIEEKERKKDTEAKEEKELKAKEEKERKAKEEKELKAKEEKELKAKEEQERKAKEEKENENKRKKEREMKLKEEKKVKAEEEQQKVKVAEEEELKAKSKEEEEKKKEDIKSKKQAIPKAIKKIVWDTYIGPDIIKHRCLCCKRVTIDNTNFHCGHVISEKDGGTLETGNLRPICSACNHSMGTENMIDFVKKYGLYIG